MDIVSFYEGIARTGTKNLINNSHHRVGYHLTSNGTLVPYSFNPGYKKDTCYLFSFLSQFVDYSAAEIASDRSISSVDTIIAKSFLTFIKFIGLLTRLDKIIFVNNQLLSTSIMPAEGVKEVPLILKRLQQAYPGYSVIFKGATPAIDKKYFTVLSKAWAIPVVSRLVYVFNPAANNYRKKRAFIRDRKLAERSTDLFWETPLSLTKADITRILELYASLYLKKHSRLNPAYTARFIEKTAQSNLLEYYLLRRQKDDKILAVQAICRVDNQLTTPFIGYDLDEPKELGLYRLMNIKLMEIAVAEGLILNMSSGAGEFKAQRGGIPNPEYHMVFPPKSKLLIRTLWNFLSWVSQKVIIPAMINKKV